MYPEVWLLCLAMNVYFESRSEPLSGQYAVAEVTIKRARLSGRSICETVFDPKQFSWTIKSDKTEINVDSPQWHQANIVAYRALKNKTNYSKGATHFHADYVQPDWARNLCPTAVIGRHIFYKTCPNVPIP